jgi:hypothetical protein
MGTITLNFSKDLNVSLQAGSGIGDIIYFKDAISDDIVRIGECQSISGNNIVCNIDDATPRPGAGDFIFFAKDSEVNTSGIIGYYAEVTFEITSPVYKELFAVNSEVFISS